MSAPPDLLAERVELLLGARRYRVALSLLRRRIAAGEENAALWLLVARAHIGLEEWAAALDAAAAALRLDPAGASPHLLASTGAAGAGSRLRGLRRGPRGDAPGTRPLAGVLRRGHSRGAAGRSAPQPPDLPQARRGRRRAGGAAGPGRGDGARDRGRGGHALGTHPAGAGRVHPGAADRAAERAGALQPGAAEDRPREPSRPAWPHCPRRAGRIRRSPICGTPSTYSSDAGW